MQPILRNEVLPLGEYELIRPHFRARVIESKKARRVRLGPIMSVTFENRDTVLLQIQEMLRTERITQEEAIKHEIDTYNELVPKDSELSFTLFVEIADKDARDRMLTDLAGLEEHVGLEVEGELQRGVAADRSVEGIARTTAVHYFKVPLSGLADAALRRGAKAALVVDHAAYQARTELDASTLASLVQDLERA